MVLIALFTLFSVNIFAQVTVTGTVLDDLGEGAAGATIREKGTQNGAAADINGKFTLKVQSAKATLIVSYVGFETQETELNGRTNVTIRLKTDAQILSEVVTIGYGTQNKVTLTGAVSNVSSDELIKAPVANLGNALQGHLPGVQTVQYSGMPGADDPVIRIRGIGTMNNAEPLVLVDGVERPFTQLDPNEVESISILKDASATAVFGVRGANGVILVTTKRGKTGKASVSVSASAAIQQISDYIDFADSYTYGRMWNYAKITDVLPTEFWPGTTYIDDYSALVPNYKDKEGNPSTYQNLGCRFNQQAMQHFKNGDMPMTYPNVNWIDYLMKSAAWQEQVNVNVNGGTDKVRYFISTSVFNQNSLFKTFSDNPN